MFTSGSPKGIDDAIDEMETNYLAAEWQRQIELGRHPGDVLGNNPPW